MTNTENSEQFFEGAEKLLEIWFTGSDGNDDSDLRKIPRQKLESMLKLVHCEVISFSSNGHIDAYVLSESSMFVTQRRFILKTCGTTTPLQCVKLLLILVQHYSGFHEVQKVFYSRKNFKRPDFQQNIYKDFKQEVSFLDSCFKSSKYGGLEISQEEKKINHLINTEGMGYCIDNGDDRWYLYSLQAEGICNGEFGDETSSADEADQTIEIMMSDLDEKVMNNFRKEKFFTAAEATKHCGIDKLIPFMEIDDYLFDPCGYSMNGILQNGSYMTIHITPEPEFSYVSFETNVPMSSYEELIRRVVKTFQPGKFIVTLLANRKSVASKTPKELKTMSKVGNEWRQVTSELCDVNNYDMTVAFYSKFPS